MKTKLGIFVLLILLTGCSNKKQTIHYSNLGMNYKTLALSADFVIKDQKEVLEYGQVSMYNTDPPTFREATQDDKLRAIELSSNMKALKILLNDAAENCDKLEKIYSKRIIINMRVRQSEIDSLIELLSITEKSISKVTGGLKPKDYMDPFVPKNLKDLMNSTK